MIFISGDFGHFLLTSATFLAIFGSRLATFGKKMATLTAVKLEKEADF